MKSRLFKYIAIGLGLLVLGAFWAFSHFFFNPFEGAYQYKLSTLVPREVDFFLTKPDLADDFDPLPRFVFADEFEASPHARALMQLDSVRDLMVEFEIDQKLVELRRGLDSLPIDVDVLDLFGGTEIAFAGFFRGADVSQADWALLGRANWMGKLGLEVVRSGFAGLEDQGISIAELPEGFTLSGGALTRPLHFTRIHDVLVLSTTPELIAKTHEFDRKRGEDSFGLSAQYADHIARLRDELAADQNGLNVFLDQRTMLEKLAVSGAWPDPYSDELGTAMAGRFFQLGIIRELMTTVTFETGFTFDVTGKLSSEKLTAPQKKLYRERGFERKDIFEFARMAPEDVGLFCFGQGPLNEIMTEFISALDEPTLELLEDPARNVWGYSDILPLLGDLSATFEDRVVFFMRNYDYPEDTSPDAPLHDDTKVAAWTLVLTVENAEALADLVNRVQSNPGAFGIQGRTPGRGGVFTNQVEGGGVVYEYHSVAVPGSGHLSTLEMFGPAGKKYFLVSNNNDMLGQVFVTYRREQGSLSKDSWFETLVNAGLPSTDIVAWFNPRAMSDTLHAIVRQRAEFDLALAINWDVERPRIEKKVLKEHFPNERYGSVSPEKKASFNERVQFEIDEFESDFTKQQLPALRRRYELPLDAAEIMRGALLQLSIDSNDFRVHGRVIVPFDQPGAE